MRHVWTGHLRISLVMVPVRAYTASQPGEGKIQLNQLHKDCHQRIKHLKTCPEHGQVSNDEIVSGYEYAKGNYAVIDPDELDKVRTESDKAISIDAFIKPEQLDPLYYSDRTYYLAPDHKVGEIPYAVIRRALEEEGLQAVGQVVIFKREQVVLIRPIEGVLAMEILTYAEQVRQPSAIKDEVPDVEISDKEVQLAKTLIESLRAEDFDFSQYKDRYAERLKALIDAKIAGQEIATPKDEAGPAVINLMDALRKSVEQAAKQTKPPKRVARSKRPGSAAQRKRKSS